MTDPAVYRRLVLGWLLFWVAVLAALLAPAALVVAFLWWSWPWLWAAAGLNAAAVVGLLASEALWP